MFIQKIHRTFFTIITFYISTYFWKHYVQYFSFTVIIFVTSKKFMIFSPEENILDISVLLISTYFNKIRFLQ